MQRNVIMLLETLIGNTCCVKRFILLFSYIPFSTNKQKKGKSDVQNGMYLTNFSVESTILTFNSTRGKNFLQRAFK